MNSRPENKTTPVLSIVIPTRERARYLDKCVETALACGDKEIEVVVSDNASLDHTRAVVERFEDPRLRYVNTGRRVPMTENFEFALAAATGDNIIFIGDDDAMVPQAVSDLLVLLRTKKPDAVRWWTGNYRWPSNPPDCDDGLLSFKPKLLVGGSRQLDAKQIWEQFCSKRIKNYRGGINIYHGCISRRVIDQVSDRIGKYFFAVSPDVGAAIINTLFCDDLIEMGRPVSISGTSSASTGSSSTSYHKSAEQQKAPHSEFAKEYIDAGETHSLALNVRSVRAATLITLLEVCDLMEQDTACINIDTWRSWVEADLLSIPEADYQEQAVLINKALINWGFSELKPRKKVTSNTDPRPPKTARKTSRLSLSPNRIRIGTHQDFCVDIASATRIAEQIIGNPPLERRRSWPGIALSWGRAMGQAIKIVHFKT